MHAVGVIPARYGSSRFPGKPLALIGGRSLIERVHARARAARRLARLVVATDDARIASAVAAFGGEAVMTSPDHPSGTDRLAEVAAAIAADCYVNIQGDEPMLDPSDIDRLVQMIEDDPRCDMVTLAVPLEDADAARDPNIVKVVCDDTGRALYFSRSPIPCPRDGDAWPAPGERGLWLRHVGIYAYRAAFLREFASWKPSTLERVEGLEQLRALQRGRTVRVLPARGRYHGVDTPEDVVTVEKALQRI